MDNFSNNIEESRFFDAEEQIAQETDFICDSPNWEYDVWIRAPQSVKERRRKFISWMGLSQGDFDRENYVDTCDNNSKCGFFSIGDSDRIMENSGAVLRTPSIEDEFSSSRSSLSSWNMEYTEDLDLSECRNGNVNFDGEVECNVDGIVENERFEKIEDNVHSPRTMDKSKNRWLSKLRSMTCMMSSNVKDVDVGPSSSSWRVRVRHSRRRLKELSALFTGQDIKAHEGAIVSMKFSLDGHYLASAGEDKVVRVWRVIEDERLDEIDVPDADPSCVYFTVNHMSELGLEKDRTNKSKSMRRTQDSACVIFPQKIFRILEKPLHVYQGHKGEILDLSWSRNNCLLSSSVDKTVRLWRVGVETMTCIQFNPMNDDYFISGSIDGKVRIWAIGDCKVVDWTETTDIITAVSYRLMSGIIGSITGTCRFFDLSDNHFQLGAQMCITIFTTRPSKILVTCADSKVRIIDGMNMIGKYKGLRNAGNQISASFTSDGKHIISASDDSNIYIWNYTNQVDSSLSKPKAIRSFECFSSDASVVIPWSGLKTQNSENGSNLSSTNLSPFSPSTYFSQSQEYFLDSISKGSATWPEEKLPVSSPQTLTSPLSKSQYKLFKTSCQSSSDSHAWGLVIITAGWDGQIRSFHNYGLPVSL
ncbi:hypothetical protein DH2020_048535 [Rehmannia glutinosa]|uniref:WD repeat-containing protein n=1 Tax=Rehmannia glutinosa TaxID=99300 RepID=A0ABR0U588_REHGL